MFGPLGFSELIFIFALALLIFGPRELPKIGRTIGKAMAEFRKASNELRRTLNTELLEEELRQNDPRRVLSDAASDLRNSVEKAGTEETSSTANTSKEAGTTSGEPATPQTPADDAPEATAGAPVVRAPTGQMARGDLASTEDKPSSKAEASVDTTEQPTDSQEKK